MRGHSGAYQKPEHLPKFPSKRKNRNKNHSKPKNRSYKNDQNRKTKKNKQCPLLKRHSVKFPTFSRYALELNQLRSIVNWTHLQFTLGKPFTGFAERIYRCIISFSGNHSHSGNGRSCSDPRNISTYQQFTKNCTSQSVREGENEAGNNAR